MDWSSDRGVLLIIPFAVAVIGQRFLVARAAARRAPLLAVYAGLSLACGVGVALGSTGALRVREAEVRINGLPAALDGCESPTWVMCTSAASVLSRISLTRSR